MFRIFVILQLILFTLPSLAVEELGQSVAADGYDSKNSDIPVRDLSAYDFSEKPSLALDGEWGFLWGEPKASAITTINVPISWPELDFPGQGRAHYFLTLILPKTNTPLSIRVEGVYSAYRLYVDNEWVASGGQIKDAHGNWQPHKNVAIATLPSDQKLLTLRLDVENFDHAFGGMRRSIVLGTQETINRTQIISDFLMLFLTGACAVLGFHYIILYIRRPTDVYYGIFAACGFCFAIKEVILYWQLGYFVPWFSPLPYTPMVRLEYWSTFLPLPLYYAFLRSLYPNEHPRWFALFTYFFVGCFLVTTLVTPSIVFTELFKPFLLGVLFIMMSAFVSAVGAVRNQRPASIWLFATYLVILFVNVHDSLLFMDVIDGANISKYGHLAILLGLSALLGQRMQSSLDEAKKLSSQLVSKVEERTRELSNKVVEVNAARGEADAANRAKSGFLAAASHDLRQPMHSIGLFLDGFEKEIEQGTYQRSLRSIENSVANLNKMFSALLDVSKLDSGSLEPTAFDFRLAPLFEDIAEEFNPLVNNKGLSLEFSNTAHSVFSDPILLGRILRNLITNAINHTEHGTVSITAHEQNNIVVIRVADTGSGIPESELDNIFAEFYQLDNPERSREKGLGLGLAIVKKLCTLLGHTIRVKSIHGKGSEFSVEVARSIAMSEDTTAQKYVDLNSSLAEQQLNGLTVLVIDNEQEVLDATQHLLEGWGCNCLLAKNMDEALIRIDEQDIDFMLVDYRLEGIQSGVDLAIKIRENLIEAVPVIIITGDTSKDIVDQARECGFAVLHKPVDPQTLQQRMQLLL